MCTMHIYGCIYFRLCCAEMEMELEVEKEGALPSFASRVGKHGGTTCVR